ncbi:hypothetical protein A0H81_10238 [Grifola frondosa]|uniref:Uncharacterized protein n=1 Tax=Grifola frondosa TaxID=5627 RepID=A0A1C7LYU8_GRIFR|nr:hypothetical protein A0H81_10238 [Grifola frondosa]
MLYLGIQTVLGRLVIPRGVVKITAPSSPMFVSADWELLVTCSETDQVMLGHLRDQTLHSAPSLAPLRLRRGYRSPDSGMGYDLSDSETIHATTQECVGRMKDEGEEEEEEEKFMSAHAGTYDDGRQVRETAQFCWPCAGERDAHGRRRNHQ